jgi:hypothetical protein
MLSISFSVFQAAVLQDVLRTKFESFYFPILATGPIHHSRLDFAILRPFSHWDDATAIRSRKKSTTLNSWRVVIASWPRWWEKRHYELKVRPVGDFKVIFLLDRIAVASPQWENGLTVDDLYKQRSSSFCSASNISLVSSFKAPWGRWWCRQL